MAKFSEAYKYTEAAEGGWTVDNGGETYKGIAFKFHTDKPIAMQIYKLVKPLNLKNEQVVKSLQIDTLVMQFYKKYFWDKIKGDEIKNQTLANFIYDFSVNVGSGIALINKGLARQYNSQQLLDAALQQANTLPAAAYQTLMKIRRAWYDKLAAKSSKLKANYNGWIARLEKFPKTLTA